MDAGELKNHLPEVADVITRHILAEPRMRHLNRVSLPNRDTVFHAVTLMRQIIFPGYYGRQDLTDANLGARMKELVDELAEMLYQQIRCCLRYRREIPGSIIDGAVCKECDEQAARITAEFLDRLPAIRDILALDVQAAFDSDPAAQSTDETIFCYPGLRAIMVQRLAHELYQRDVPLLPRMMTEHAHSLTGIDIHPGAVLGRKFFIDHGTGVVIGETTVIGDNVKIYQGVTLGALAPAYGQLLRGQKRHPTIQNDVTIYAGATILGGDTVIGEGCTIGGAVFITSSVPPHNQVSAEPPKLKYRDRRPGRRGDFIPDFQI